MESNAKGTFFTLQLSTLSLFATRSHFQKDLFEIFSNAGGFSVVVFLRAVQFGTPARPVGGLHMKRRVWVGGVHYVLFLGKRLQSFVCKVVFKQLSRLKWLA